MTDLIERLRAHAAALLITLVAAGLVGCGSADNDPAQQRVEKPVTVETQR